MSDIAKGMEYIIKIESVSSDGSGVAHIDGFTVFVPQTVTEDTVKIKIENVQKRFARAKLVEIIEPSADRQEADCPYYEQCGGCQLRHIKYEKQLEIKHLTVENAMKRISGFNNFCIDEVYGANNTERYRNKMVFPVGQKNDKTVCGFYAQKSHDIIPLGDCSLGDGINSAIINTVLDYMNDNNIAPYNEHTHKGTIRRIFTRKSFSSNEFMVVISATVKTLPRYENLIQRLQNISDRIVSVILNVNTGNMPLGNKNITLWGKNTLSDTLCGVTFSISPNSFFQVNPEQTEKLYRKTLEFAQIDKNTSVMDIYCGIGTISLCVAQTAKNVIGIEVVHQAIADARENAAANGITNTEFYADSAENIVPKLIANSKTTDVVILDPPRKGSDEKTLSAIIKSNAKRIVYVSCNPATLARDARLLADSGYTVTHSAIFDLFPHTVHIETVVLFER